MGTTAQQLTCLREYEMGRRGQCSLIVDGTYCHPSFCLAEARHECIKFASEGRMKIGKSLRLSKHKGRWHYQIIKVKADGRGAELIGPGGGRGNMQLNTQKTGCTLTMGQWLWDSMSVGGQADLSMLTSAPCAQRYLFKIHPPAYWAVSLWIQKCGFVYFDWIKLLKLDFLISVFLHAAFPLS